jgi:hypothetical protein
MPNTEPLIILDDQGSLLCGHDILERVLQGKKSEQVHIVRGIKVEAYIAMLKLCFSDFQCVAMMHLDSISNDELRRISETVVLTQEHVDMMQRTQSK